MIPPFILILQQFFPVLKNRFRANFFFQLNFLFYWIHESTFNWILGFLNFFTRTSIFISFHILGQRKVQFFYFCGKAFDYPFHCFVFFHHFLMMTSTLFRSSSFEQQMKTNKDLFGSPLMLVKNIFLVLYQPLNINFIFFQTPWMMSALWSSFLLFFPDNNSGRCILFCFAW